MIHIEGEGDIYDDAQNESSKNGTPDNGMGGDGQNSEDDSE